jgi:ABC-2 type transport system ATP-binding protein
MRAVSNTSSFAPVDDTERESRQAGAPTPQPAIVAQRLTKTYTVADKDPGLAGTLRHFFHRRERAIHAVRDASFSVAEGEVVGFLGPNGAGKTTTLKMLTGLLHPTSGTVSVLGYTPFARDHSFLRAVTLVMGNKQQLMWDLPAADSLRIQAAVYGVPDDERDKRTRALSEMLDVTDKLSQPVRKLSLGERMKVEILAALLHRPRVLFLDEPTLGLDVNAQAAVRSFLRDYNQREHATILLTSHDMTDISALCRRVLVIDDGALVFDGSLDRLVREKNAEREIVIDFATSPSVFTLPNGARLVERDGLRARIAVRPDATTRVVTELLASHDVRDLAVHDPPIEDVVRSMFKKGPAPDAAPADDDGSLDEKRT